MAARWMALGLRRRDGRRGTGQVLVLFALSIVVLLAFAGLAFDIGRFYSEKRFLQNAADAAALAAANALIRGATDTEARDEAKAILTRNYLSDPTGRPPSLPPDTPVYASGHAGDPLYLANGILINAGDVRVSIQNQVDWTFGRAVGLTTNTIGGQARVKLVADMLPIAVRHYLSAPGPNAGATTPCPGDGTGFMDALTTSDTSCLGTETDASLREDPSDGMPFDPVNPDNDPSHHGPIIAIVGQGAAPSNSADFRGFITLDIRNFASSTSNVFYNNVTAGTSSNTLKDMEAGWIVPGYPGPAFPPATSPPDPDDQVGIMSGNSAGIVVDEVPNRYRVGDEITTAVYSGTVMTIPDFSYAVPASVPIGTTQNRSNAVAMTVYKNNAFTGVVTTTAHADPNDAANPLLTGTLAPLTFSPQPATPQTNITWTSFQTTGAPVGIYTIWIQGHSSSPYLTDHYYPVAINVGGVGRDFGVPTVGQVSAQTVSIANTGMTATKTVTFGTTNKSATAFRGTVNLSIEGGIADGGVLPPAMGPVSVSPSSINLTNSANSQDVTVSLDSGSLGPGEYNLVLRASGTNFNGDPVTHLVPIVFDVATGTTNAQYVDIMGFAVFRIVELNSNYISAYAITPVIADQNDSRLHHGQVAKLVPWN